VQPREVKVHAVVEHSVDHGETDRAAEYGRHHSATDEALQRAPHGHAADR
jgi:hypothetical protein